MNPQLPPPPPLALVPPRPDVAVPPPRRRRRWPVAIVAGIVAMTVVAQVGAVTWFADRPEVQGEFAFIGSSPDGPYRWNPCQPIHYEVNVDNAPPGALADVREAIHRVSEATGIGFVEEGMTARTVDMQIGRAFQSRIPGEPRYLPLLVDWVPHEHFDFVADTHKAAAFAQPSRGFGDLARTYVSGVVAMDAGERLPGGFGQRYSRGVVLMHELAHVMGLAHVGSPNEIMWSPETSDLKAPNLWQSDWGPGDLEGLAAVGREAGCLPARPGN
jgi:hypothetical protein